MSMNLDILKAFGKYGPLGLIALWMTYFLTTSMEGKLTNIEKGIDTSNQIQREMLAEMEKHNGQMLEMMSRPGLYSQK